MKGSRRQHNLGEGFSIFFFFSFYIIALIVINVTIIIIVVISGCANMTSIIGMSSNI